MYLTYDLYESMVLFFSKKKKNYGQIPIFSQIHLLIRCLPTSASHFLGLSCLSHFFREATPSHRSDRKTISIYSLTLDEFQHTLYESGKNFRSMNMGRVPCQHLNGG
ncbi:hypothetical protein I3760_07G176600 [Carya illinoinensis]|nr:hypothetical protein I3760_07G176600 [Carya illinoinensis]